MSPGRDFAPESAASATQDAIRQGADRLYQPTFVAAGAKIRADALERDGDRWTLVEVKSTKSPRDDRERKKKIEEHLADVAVQAAVIRASGAQVGVSQLMLLNRECVHPRLENLFVREDVTPEVDGEAVKVLPAIAELLGVVRGEMPSTPVGDQCTEPDDCPFYDRCHEKLPDHHVTELYYARRKEKQALMDAGKAMIRDLAESDTKNAAAQRQIRSICAGRRIVEPTLLAALDELKTPIIHLDFETVQLAVPRWPGCSPQDMIAIQFSVHRERGDGTVEHVEHLAERGDDPRPALIRDLIAACRGAATILVYYEQFEKARLHELAAWFPQHAADLNDIHDRVVDLLPIVRNNVYDQRFRGSFSLKQVLPALVEGMSYDDLNIREGGAATAAAYRLLFDETLTGNAADAIRTDLLAYCRRDTEAMVRLLGVLRSIAT